MGSQNGMIRLLLVDDHPLYRMGLRNFLSQQSDFYIVGEAENGTEVFPYLTSNNVDVIIMDVNMPKMDGIATALKLKETNPEIAVIGVSVSNEIYKIIGMQNAGAKGYLLKTAHPNEFITAINTVFWGRLYYCHETAGVISKLAATFNSTETMDKTGLTTKEIAIIQLVCEGLSNKEIGEKLFQSPRTIEWHRTQILDKLKLKTTTDVVKYTVVCK